MAALGRLLGRRVLAFTVVVILAADGMLVWRAIVLWGRFLGLRQTAQTSVQRLEALRGLAGRHSRNGMAAEITGRVVSADSEERLQQRFLEELGPWIREGDFPVTVKPKPLQREGAVVRLMIELSVEATQDHLVKFLDRVLDDASMVVVERFRLAPSGVAMAPVRATFVLSKPVVQTLSEAPQRPASSAPSSVSVPSSIEQTPSIAMAVLRPLFRTGTHPATSSHRLHTDQGNAAVERLQVVGMITGSPSQAVLEDAKTHKTYVVGAGQSVGDGVMVEAILPHSVVLNAGGESYELSW